MVASPEIRRLVGEIVERLVRGYGPQKIMLFGSYAYGNPLPDSDIDLLIIKDTSDRFIDRCFKVRSILSDTERTTPLEAIVLTPREVTRRVEIGDQFLAEMLERGEVLYEA